MALNPRAQKNHDDLFQGYVSKVTVTDPELSEIFGNFAFDEVLAHGNLDARTRLMVLLASTIACQALLEYRMLFGPAMVVGVTPVEIKEIVYQAVPYVGIAKVLDFIEGANEFLVERGVALPLQPQSVTTPEDRFEKGLEIQKQIAGEEGLRKMLDSAPSDQQHIYRFLAANCFGDHVSRGGIDLAMRELLTFSMLISLGGCDLQVKGHVAANLRVGNTRATLISVVTQLLPYIGYPRALNALRAIDEIVPFQSPTST
jgi:4-carboxymuconolactone decarboxylase